MPLATWLDIACDNRRSTSDLVSNGLYRSAVSRAYYAVYARVTMEFHLLGVAMPTGRESPRHSRLRPLIETSLTSVTYEKRRALSRMVSRLYTMRLLADYRASATVGLREGREAASLVKKAFNLL